MSVEENRNCPCNCEEDTKVDCDLRKEMIQKIEIKRIKR